MCVHVSPHLSMWAELRFLHGALAAPSYTESPRHIAYPNLPEQLMQASYPTLLASLPVCQDGKQGTFVFCLETPIPEKSPGSSAHPGTCGKHHLYSWTWYPCEERENKGKHCVSWDAASKICQLEMELSNSTHLLFFLSLISTRQLTTYLHSVYIVWYQESSRGHKTYRSPGDKAW